MVKRKGSRHAVIDWCARQLAARAESLEAHELVTHATQHGYEVQDVLWEFLFSQWPMVVQEAHQRFKDAGDYSLLKDGFAMKTALTAMAPKLFPLTFREPVEKVAEELRRIGTEEGWTFDPNP